MTATRYGRIGLSALGTGAGHLATAWLNEHRVAVAQAHRLGPAEGLGEGPVLVTVTAPVGLTLGDVAAVLLDWVNTGGTFEDLDDDGTVRAFVAEYVVNEGCFGLEKAQVQAATMAAAPVLEYCRQRAATVFTPESTTDPVVPGRSVASARTGTSGPQPAATRVSVGR